MGGGYPRAVFAVVSQIIKMLPQPFFLPRLVGFMLPPLSPPLLWYVYRYATFPLPTFPHVVLQTCCALSPYIIFSGNSSTKSIAILFCPDKKKVFFFFLWRGGCSNKSPRLCRLIGSKRCRSSRVMPSRWPIYWP